MDTHYINEVLNGNDAAFSYLMRKHQNKGFAIAMSVLKNQDDAKDAVQDSFILAYHALHKFNKDSKFSTWLYKIIINTSLQLIAKKKRRIEVVNNYKVTYSETVAYNSALEKLNNDELKDLVINILRELPPKEALVIQLFYIDDYRINEIEELTGFTSANIKVLMHRGRNSFYKHLKRIKHERG